jgi:hypothetical protein
MEGSPVDALRPTLIDLDGDVREQLDRLATWVADRLDRGDDDAAWAVTVAAEALRGRTAAGDPRPASPVIGRRFAAAHRQLLDQAGRPSCSARAAA